KTRETGRGRPAQARAAARSHPGAGRPRSRETGQLDQGASPALVGGPLPGERPRRLGRLLCHRGRQLLRGGRQGGRPYLMLPENRPQVCPRGREVSAKPRRLKTTFTTCRMSLLNGTQLAIR